MILINSFAFFSVFLLLCFSAFEVLGSALDVPAIDLSVFERGKNFGGRKLNKEVN